MLLGCIDCTHVSIVAPSNNEEIYVNRKNTHSINIQSKCDSELKCIDVVAKWPGSTHDAFIRRMSGINQRISSGDVPIVNGWFLGESGYPLRPNLLTPILSPETPSERRYNDIMCFLDIMCFWTMEKSMEIHGQDWRITMLQSIKRLPLSCINDGFT